MDIEKCIKGLFNLFSTDDLIIAYGEGLYVFTNKGELVFSKKNIKNIYKVAVLPANRVVVDCSSTRKYIVISLTDGKELCSIKQPKMDYSSPKLTVSEDGHFVYDFYLYEGVYNVIRIDIQDTNYETVSLAHGLNTICDMICDKDGTLCILQSQNEMICDNEISVRGIRYEYFDPCLGHGSAYYWKAKWYYPCVGHTSRFFGNVDTIITGDKIHSISAQSKVPFFQVNNAIKLDITHLYNGEEILLKSDPIWCKTIDERYIQIVCSDSNIIVDRIQNKIIARYFSQTNSGCIVDDEFWITSTEGILRKKFPTIESEALRPKRSITWEGQGDGFA